MNLNKWYRKWRTQRRTRPACRTPALCLQQLEQRMLPSGGLSDPPANNGPAATPPPPSTFQAAVSLFLDGAFLTATFSAFQPPTAAAANGITDNVGRVWFEVIPALRGWADTPSFQASPITVALNDIQSNWAYAGPLAPLAVSAGAQAAMQAVQQPLVSSTAPPPIPGSASDNNFNSM